MKQKCPVRRCAFSSKRRNTTLRGYFLPEKRNEKFVERSFHEMSNVDIDYKNVKKYLRIPEFYYSTLYNGKCVE